MCELPLYAFLCHIQQQDKLLQGLVHKRTHVDIWSATRYFSTLRCVGYDHIKRSFLFVAFVLCHGGVRQSFYKYCINKAHITESFDTFASPIALICISDNLYHGGNYTHDQPCKKRYLTIYCVENKSVIIQEVTPENTEAIHATMILCGTTGMCQSCYKDMFLTNRDFSPLSPPLPPNPNLPSTHPHTQNYLVFGCHFDWLLLISNQTAVHLL